MELRLSFTNLNEPGGTFATPVWFGLSNPELDGFDLFDVGAFASEGVERVAEDGTVATIAEEFSDMAPNGQGGVLFGDGVPPVIDPGETSQLVVDVDPINQSSLQFITMVIPSNDAFLGTASPVMLFDDGIFLGQQSVILTGFDVYDAGTELNTEEDAAFINQTGPDTGVDEEEEIALHPGFNGSVGNPDTEFEQNILGGTTAVGAVIDPVIGDFTIDRNEPLGVFRVNIVERTEGSADDDFFFLQGVDDIAFLATGDDFASGGDGWDELHGEGGDDTLLGDGGADTLYGGDGEDLLHGDDHDDVLVGGDEDDVLIGGAGDDMLNGDTPEGRTSDKNTFIVGEGNDSIARFDVDGGSEISFDRLLVEFDFTALEGIDPEAADALITFGSISTEEDFAAIVGLLADDGTDATAAIIDGEDLLLVFDSDADGAAVDSVRLEDIVVDDSLSLVSLTEAGAELLA